MSRAPSRRQVVTVEKNSTRGSAKVVASSTGAQALGGERRERAVEAARRP